MAEKFRNSSEAVLQQDVSGPNLLSLQDMHEHHDKGLFHTCAMYLFVS